MSQTVETTEVLFARYGPRYRIYVTVVALLGTVSAVVTTTTVNVADTLVAEPRPFVTTTEYSPA